ncbi:pilus assembly PilX N-terminal domain-containing protein [Gracilibacillus halotolerans]
MLVYTLLVFLIFTILGVSLMAYTYSDVKLSKVDQKQQAAFYIAEAGANEAFYDIDSYIDDLINMRAGEKIEFEYIKFEEQFGEQPSAEVVLEKQEDQEYDYVIKSTGKIGEQERAVSKEFTIKFEEDESSTINLPEGVGGIFRDEFRKNGNSGEINGDIYVLSGVVIANPLDKAIKGTIFVPRHKVNDSQMAPLPHEYDINWYNQLSNKIEELVSSFPEEAIFYDSINETLNIDTKDKTMNIVVDDFNSNANIKVKGDGKVNLYIRKNINLNKNLNNNGDANQLTIYYAGHSEIKINGGNVLVGSIIAPNSDVTTSGNPTIKGIVIAKTLEGNGAVVNNGENIDVSNIISFPVEDNNGREIITAPTIEIK